jgi:hypothetical protein
MSAIICTDSITYLHVHAHQRMQLLCRNYVTPNMYDHEMTLMHGVEQYRSCIDYFVASLKFGSCNCAINRFMFWSKRELNNNINVSIIWATSLKFGSCNCTINRLMFRSRAKTFWTHRNFFRFRVTKWFCAKNRP